MPYNMFYNTNANQNNTTTPTQKQPSVQIVRNPKDCNVNDLKMVRKDLIGELDAINQYEEHIAMISDENAKKVLIDIRNEEIVHTGELIGLLNHLCPDEAEFREVGMSEFKDIIKS